MKKRTKKLVLGFTALLLIVVGIFCMARWKVWFGNPEEPPFVLTTQPQRVILTFGNDGEFSRNVSWVCGGAPRSARLEYTRIDSKDTLSINASTRFLRTLGGYTFVNWAKFGKLSSGEKYSYRVWSGEKASPWYSFSTHADSTDHFSFTFIGDVQDTLRGSARQLMDDVRRQLPQSEFYMLVGDFVERPMNCFWEEAYESIDSIAPFKPMIAAAGNHEYIKGLPSKLSRRFVYAFSYFIDSQYEGNSVYSIDYKDASIFVLDSNQDMCMLLSQREWLKKQLQASTKKWKIVMLHHPVYSIKGKINNLPVRMAFASLLEDEHVDLVLEGHEHNYARMTTKTDEGQPTTPVYVVSHASPKSYKLFLNKKYDLFGTNRRFYQSVDVHGDTLQLKTFLEDNSLYDHLCIIKDQQGTRVLDLAKNIE